MLKNLFTYSLVTSLFIFILLIKIGKILLLSYFLGWFITFCLIILLIMTFNFFFKYVMYSKYSSHLQRFWRRSFTVFWIVESCWFLIFLYCLNVASHEPIYYEELYFYKFLFIGNFKSIIITNIMLFLIIITLYSTIIFIKKIVFYQFIMYILIINFCLFICLYTEIYQFVNVVSFFWEITWLFNQTTAIFEFIFDYFRFRPRMAFFFLVLILKFWHCIFIIGSWVFFLHKSVEKKLISLSMLSMNYQNICIFYVMSYIQFFSLFKWYTKYLWKKLWFWFFINPSKINIINIFSDLLKDFNFILYNLILRNYINNFYKYFYLYNSNNFTEWSWLISLIYNDWLHL